MKGDMIRANLSYDATNKRFRMIEEHGFGKKAESYDILYLHDKQTEFRFNLRTKKCKKVNVTMPWRNAGIPKKAINFGDSYYGAAEVPDAHLLIGVWKDEFIHPINEKVLYMGTWTNKACLPVTATYLSKIFNVHSTTLDITTG
jgi:hypothetical protein